MTALFLVATGVVAFRWDTNIAGFLVVMPTLSSQLIAYTSYRPSLVEIVSGAAIIAYGLTAFSLGVRYLRVVDHTLIEEEYAIVKVKAGETVRV
jgi:hypothetical protein